ncbi:hypothetical protein SBRCBS47491_009031 [Sporothrix bragantina]|uniref:Cell cycle control protein n=1 Tax=Sporothrix bragantina TaxID=671064 RepID=A0ABP0CRB9_9PEZI
MSRQRAEPDVIDLTEEPDSPVLQHADHASGPFRTAARSAARSARPSVGSRQPSSSAAVIDLTGDDDVVVGDSFARRMEERQRRHDTFSRNLANEMREQQRNHSASRSIFSAFSMGNIAHLTSLALGAATGRGASNPANNNDGGPARRVQSAHRQARSAARAHSHRMQQAQNVADRHYLDLAEAQFAMALSRNRRRGASGPGMGHGFFGHGHGGGLFEDIDELQLLQAAGLDPLGENAPHLDYRQNGGLPIPGFVTADVWRSAGAGVGGGGNNGGHSGLVAPVSGAIYEAPGDTMPGYTRETGEELVAICASCDRELAYDPDDGEGSGNDGQQPPPAKRTRRSKDTAQHHFWAVRSCGHVYCRACYENRKHGIKKDGSSGSRAQQSGGASGSGSSSAPSVMFLIDGKTIYCAAEGCQADVTTKSKWQGLFV